MRFTQTITPDTGLELSPSLDGTVMDITGGKTDDLTQWIVTTAEGNYEIVTTATVVETGEKVSARNEVRVIAPGSPSIMVTGPVGRGALKPDTITPFTLGAEIFGKDADKVEGVTVKENRTGQQWTMQEGSSSQIYTVDISLDTRGMAPDECFTFRSIVHTTKGEVVSEEQKVCVTGLPLTMTNITREEIKAGFTAPDGTEVAKDAFTVEFKPNVLESRIREIVAAHGGIIIGANPDDKRIQVRLAPAPASLEALLRTMHQMLQRPEVVWMNPEYLIDMNLSLKTSDPEQDRQGYLKHIRAGYLVGLG
ncbi:hypothetical protein [Nitrosococcus watsonii]|uniref:Uncharacterized protein n=1 Tax=Nitrosococcus watsoni (strain C-113) TaxID=105559 RepID=D8K7H2_NITWC|nr:hypothetical protein [Nitrosococcus watsonii]ADJ28849.1 hypothetical protein Nwat_2015 [Nitrosococcus watsonii C-113]